MTTYSVLKCTVCKRVTEVEIDPRRPTINHCTITHKCTGRLQQIDTKTVRDQLVTKNVNGLKNWQQRGHVDTEVKSAVTEYMTINTGNSLSVAVASSLLDSEIHNETLSLNLIVQSKNIQPFTSFSYYGFTADMTVIAGADSTPSKKLLRFDTTDALIISLNGVVLDSAVMPLATAIVSGGVVTGITIQNAGSGFTEAPTIILTGAGNSAAATATINSDGTIASIHVTSGGNGYTSSFPVTFVGGVSGKTVYYRNESSLSFSPAIAMGSNLNIAIIPYIEPEKANLIFQQNATNSAGAWSNVKTVNINNTEYVIFVCDDMSTVTNETHFIVSDLRKIVSNGNISDWHFVLATNPFTNVDRIYDFVTPASGLVLSSAKDSTDIFVDTSALIPTYPTIDILERNAADFAESTPGTVDVYFPNPYILSRSN